MTMSSLKSQSPLKHPQIHTVLPFPPLPSQGCCISGKEIEVHGSGSPWSFSVIRALADRPPLVPSTMSCVCWDLQFPIQTHMAPSPGPPARVLSPFSFLQCLSCILPNCSLHICYILLFSFLSCVAKGAPKPRGPIPTFLPKAEWSQPTTSFHTGAIIRGSCFPVTSWVEVTPISLTSVATAI